MLGPHVNPVAASNHDEHDARSHERKEQEVLKSESEKAPDHQKHEEEKSEEEHQQQKSSATPESATTTTTTDNFITEFFDNMFDLVVPTASLGSLALCIIGPLYVPKLFLVFLLSYFVFSLSLSMSHFFKLQLTISRVRQTIRNGNLYNNIANLNNNANNNASSGNTTSTSGNNTSPSMDVDRDADSKAHLLGNNGNNGNTAFSTTIAEVVHTHVFIIPNYKEPLSLLQRTVGRLASHRAAKTHYVVVLAMEESEQGCELKAETLKNEFDGMFKDMLVTVHPVGVPGEARGKGSNVNYAVREACAALVRKAIPMKQMIVTISDSDSWIPELYITTIERSIVDMPAHRDPYATVFTPPIFFSRNSHQVPAAVRIADIMWSVMVMQNLSNIRGINFPCSTYSLSMLLADRVGYWDPDAAAIGEDMHMSLKCFFKGNARSQPIYVPINLTNVQTPGYVSNLHARYVQARRHFMGVADVAYTLGNALKITPNAWRRMTLGDWFDRALVCFLTLEAHVVPATSGWLLTLGILGFQLLYPYHVMYRNESAATMAVVTDAYPSGGMPPAAVVAGHRNVELARASIAVADPVGGMGVGVVGAGVVPPKPSSESFPMDSITYAQTSRGAADSSSLSDSYDRQRRDSSELGMSMSLARFKREMEDFASATASLGTAETPSSSSPSVRAEALSATSHHRNMIIPEATDASSSTSSQSSSSSSSSSFGGKIPYPDPILDDPVFSKIWLATKILGALSGIPIILCAMSYPSYHRFVDRELLKKEDVTPSSSSPLALPHHHSPGRRYTSVGSSGVRAAGLNCLFAVLSGGGAWMSTSRFNTSGSSGRPRSRSHAGSSSSSTSSSSRFCLTSWFSSGSLMCGTVLAHIGVHIAFLMDVIWLPYSAFFYLTLPSNLSSLQRLLFAEKGHKYVVAEKMVDFDD
ncbi:hypothetical protein HK102_003498 [Quaeritorhiza haematococci]|nr:hypothetical protein HK102_003498 [Quaeritorhiza haematococci]